MNRKKIDVSNAFLEKLLLLSISLFFNISILFFFAVKSGPHQCNVCKNTVDSSRAVSNKNLAFLLGLSESDVGSETRVCNPCFMKAQRKKGNSHCPIPVCTSTKGRVKGRLRHMPNKLKDLPKDARDAINNEFRKFIYFIYYFYIHLFFP